jgi:uncharacterized protein with gpF-like domain
MKKKTLNPVIPNAGGRMKYQRALERMVDNLYRSVVYWVTAAYRKQCPRIAQDKSPADEIQKDMTVLSARWTKKINSYSEEFAQFFGKNAVRNADAAMRESLKQAGFAIEFQMTPAVSDTLGAIVHENVSLIKSIGQEYLGQVEQSVFRAVSEGKGLDYIVGQIQHRYDLSRRRAVFIARDQNSKATALITRERQKEVGITQARWRHSHGGHKPRPDHVAAGAADAGKGLIYDVSKGAYLEGVWTWPGYEINCRCSALPIIPGI